MIIINAHFFKVKDSNGNWIDIPAFKGDPGEDAVVDTTLKTQGAAADAKAVGDAIDELSSNIQAVNTSVESVADSLQNAEQSIEDLSTDKMDISVYDPQHKRTDVFATINNTSATIQRETERLVGQYMTSKELIWKKSGGNVYQYPGFTKFDYQSDIYDEYHVECVYDSNTDTGVNGSERSIFIIPKGDGNMHSYTYMMSILGSVFTGTTNVNRHAIRSIYIGKQNENIGFFCGEGYFNGTSSYTACVPKRIWGVKYGYYSNEVTSNDE